MGRKKRQLPPWVQYLIVWIVVSGLSATGALFLRSRDALSDAIFQPLVPVLCSPGSRIETAYSSRQSTVDRLGRSSQTGRQQVSTGLDRATCVAPDGRTTVVTGRLTAAVLALGGAAGAVLIAFLVLMQRRAPRRR